MPDTDLLDRIDTLTADLCHHCDRPRGESVSDWFCGDECQQAWTEHHNAVVELAGYVEPLGGWRRDAYSTIAAYMGSWIDLFGDQMRTLGRAFLAAPTPQYRLTWASPSNVTYWLDEPSRHCRFIPNTPESTPAPDVERMDMSWLDHYIPSLDDPRDPVADARRLFPRRDITIPPGALVEVVGDDERAGPRVHADPRRNR